MRPPGACGGSPERLASRQPRLTRVCFAIPSLRPCSTLALTCATSRSLPATPTRARRCVTTEPARTLTATRTTSWLPTWPLAPDRVASPAAQAPGDARTCRNGYVIRAHIYARSGIFAPAFSRPCRQSPCSLFHRSGRKSDRRFYVVARLALSCPSMHDQLGRSVTARRLCLALIRGSVTFVLTGVGFLWSEIAQSREGSGSMNTRKSVLSAAVVMGALVAIAGLPAGTALAQTGINVPCSGPGGGAAGLAAAINAANAAGGGAISLAPGCTYTLTAAGSSGPLGANGLPIVRTRITIAGAHAIIARSSSQQFRILEVDGPGGNLSLTGLTITGGDANEPGGGVFNNAGTLTLNSSAVTGNTTSADAGGILNKAGTAVLNASRVDHNTSGSGG